MHSFYEPTKVESDLTQSRFVVTEKQERVYEIFRIIDTRFGVDVEATHERPDMAPAPGEHARLHRAFRRKEAKDVLEDAVWKGADPIVAAGHGRFLGDAPVKHSAEQVVSAVRCG